LPDENGLWRDTRLRSSKYLNNIIEQDHRGVKARIGPMLGFKRFRRAKVTIAGIELLHRIHGLRKYVKPGEPVALLFEDAGIRVFNRPPNLHLISTVGMLRGLERGG
jgi:DDE domain